MRMNAVHLMQSTRQSFQIAYFGHCYLVPINVEHIHLFPAFPLGTWNH